MHGKNIRTPIAHDYARFPELAALVNGNKAIQTTLRLWTFEGSKEDPDAEAELATGFTNEFDGSARHVGTITCAAKAEYTNADYTLFSIHDGSAEVKYYVWYDVDGLGVDPAIAGRTAIKADLQTDTTATEVATRVAALIEALAQASASSSAAIVSYTSDNAGKVEEPDGSNSPDTVATTIAGTDTGSDNYIYAVSSSANDAAAGTHARTITILGTDADGYITDTVTLTGTTIVKSAKTFCRIITMWVQTAGASNVTGGNVTLRDHGGNETFATISTGNTHILSARFYIAENYACVVLQHYAEIVQATAAAALTLDIAGKSRLIVTTADNVTEPVQPTHMHTPYLKTKECNWRQFLGEAGGSKLTLWHQTVNTGGNPTTLYRIALAVYRRPGT